MAIRASVTLRNAALKGQSIATLIDGTSGNGSIDIHVGAVNGSFGSPPAGAKLATLTLNRPSFGTPASGSMTAAAITSDISADASGTAASFVLRDSSGNIHLDGTVTVTAGGGDLVVASVTWTAGDTIACSSLIMSIPQS